MKKLFFMFIFMVLTTNLSAQIPWVVVDSDTLFHSNLANETHQIDGFAFPSSPDTGFMMPLQLRTTDGGKTWSKNGFSGLYCQCNRQIKFLNSQFGYVSRWKTGSTSDYMTPLFLTTDGGENWRL